MAAGFFIQLVPLNCVVTASFCINHETLTDPMILVDRKHLEIRFL